MRTTTALTAAALLAAATTASATTAGLRCGNALIGAGDSVMKVRNECNVYHEAALVNGHGNRVATALYVRGAYGQRDRRVTTQNGRVVEIERLR